MPDGRATRCGRISYTNDLPIYAAFDLGALPFPGTLRAGVPTELNRALLVGELDIGPVSSFFQAHHADELQLLPGICIGARMAVKSIYCFSARHPRELAKTEIAVTRDSSTGRALFDTICRTWYGFAPMYVESDEAFLAYRDTGMPSLVIGDAAIDGAMAAPSAHAHDLGLLWYEQTGADMVFAVWAVRTRFARQHPDDVRRVMDALGASLRWGAAHRARVIERAQALHPRPDGFYQSYYATLNYDFDDAARRGLELFLATARACGAFAAADEVIQHA